MAYHHGDLRKKILDVADEIVREAGIDQLSVRACAKRAGVSVTAPLYHFPNAKALVTALAVKGFETLLNTVEEVKTREGLTDGTELAIRAYVAFGRERSGYFSFMFRDALLNPEDEALQDVRSKTFGRLNSMVNSDPGLEIVPGSRASHEIVLKTWIIAHGLSALLFQTRAIDRLSGPEPNLGSVDEIIDLVASHEFLRLLPLASE